MPVVVRSPVIVRFSALAWLSVAFVPPRLMLVAVAFSRPKTAPPPPAMDWATIAAELLPEVAIAPLVERVMVALLLLWVSLLLWVRPLCECGGVP